MNYNNYTKIIIALIAVLSFAKVNAQDIKYGVKVGLNNYSVNGVVSSLDDIGVYDSEIYGVPSSNSRISFHLGGVAEFALSEKFAMQVELLFSSQGQRTIDEIKSTEPFTSDRVVLSTDLVTKLDYIVLPIAFKYKATKAISIEAGPQIGYLVSAKRKGEVNGTSGFVSNIPIERLYDDNIKKELKSIDFGLIFGLGYQLKSGLIVQARYYLGLSEIVKEDNFGEFSAKNQGLQVSIVHIFK